jgi:hypothetical protein
MFAAAVALFRTSGASGGKRSQKSFSSTQVSFSKAMPACGGWDAAKEFEQLDDREALGERFVKDKPVFSKNLTRAYVAGQESQSDVQ